MTGMGILELELLPIIWKDCSPTNPYVSVEEYNLIYFHVSPQQWFVTSFDFVSRELVAGIQRMEARAAAKYPAHRTSPVTKIYLAPDVESAEFEKLLQSDFCPLVSS